MRLDFRAPGLPIRLVDLLRRAGPGADDAWAEQVVAKASVEVGGTAIRSPAHLVAPGERVGILGADSLLGAGVALAQLPEAWSTLEVLAPAAPWLRGILGAPGSTKREKAGRPSTFQVAFEQRERRGSLAVWRLTPSRPSLRRTLDRLARAGFPVLGDVRAGGILTDAGLAVISVAPDAGSAGAAPGSLEAQRLRWPSEPVFPSSGPGEPLELRISHPTARVLAKGHPWVLRDDDSGDAGRYEPGTIVALRDPAGRGHGLARVEGPGELSARVWQRDTSRVREASSVEARVARALEHRRDLLEPAPGVPLTDAYRLIHGEADGLPGVVVDRLGPLLRVIETGRSAEGFRERMVDALCAHLSPALDEPPVVLVVHGREGRPGQVECVRRIDGAAGTPAESEGARLLVRERGLSFFVETGLADPLHPVPGTGLYLDQRENRARLARIAAKRGGRWLNLFAHTGAFSVALLAAGAEEVRSVDLSGHYLRWLEDNLDANAGFDASCHQGIKMDGRRYLLGSGEGRADEGAAYQGIVLDPPTAAASGRNFFSVSRDLEPMVGASLERLVPGGVLLVSRNQRRLRGDLRELVKGAAARVGVSLARLEDAPPGLDFPRLRGFPEGDSFRGLIATRKGG